MQEAVELGASLELDRALVRLLAEEAWRDRAQGMVGRDVGGQVGMGPAGHDDPHAGWQPSG